MMFCYLYVDQQIVLWLNNILNWLYFYDERLNYVVFDLFDWQVRNVCDVYMGIYCVFVKCMFQFGEVSGDGVKLVFFVVNYMVYC